MTSMTTIHITANSRLSTTLKQQAIQTPKRQTLEMQNATASVIETPVVMTLAQWWQQWQEGCLLRGELDLKVHNRKVLNRFESQWLWEQVLQQELERREERREEAREKEVAEGDAPLSKSIALLNVASTAKQLQQAWELSQEWFTESWLEEAYVSEEVVLFKQCQTRYLNTLEKKGWWDEVLEQKQLLTRLQQEKVQQEKVQQRKGTLPNAFCLHGFDELTPYMQQWQSVVEARGVECQIMEMPRIEKNSPPLHYTAPDTQDEVQQVALWCVKQWQQLSHTKPAYDIKIGVVSPNVADYKVALSHCLDEQLCLQGLQDLNLNRTTLPFYNISLGVPLLECPLVQNALLSLQLFLMPQQPCAYSDWSQWLTSVYTSGDLVQRQQADAAFRKLQWASVCWPALLETQAAKSLPKSLTTILQDRVQNKAHVQDSQATQKAVRLSVFVTSVWHALEQIEWATARSLNSDEYQQKTAFESAITQFSTLTDMAGKQSVSAWLSLFKRFLSEQLHQSQSKGLQPIQIMGTLEAGGQTFDALWVLGLTDSAWPGAAHPNPFLPIALQRETRSLRCDAQRELDYAQKVTERLMHCAPHIVCSYAKQQGDAEQLPSPLIERLSLNHYSAIPYESLAFKAFQQPPQTALEWVLDAQGPEVPKGSKAPGGTGFLQAQSQCPLMAFMDYRLGAKYGLQSVEEGLQSTNQGSLVHEVLEHFWQETQTQTAMLALSEEALFERLNKHIEHSFLAVSSSMAPVYLTLEKNRILALCLDWLTLEKQRSGFSVIETERHYQIELAGIQFKVVIDRVDEVAGEKVIMDYKTGKASINNLLNTPTKAPQLAAYLHAVDGEVSGIGYGVLHSDDGVKISAVVNDEEVLYKDRSIQLFAKMAEKEGGEFYEVTWSHFLEHLKRQVLDLAQQIQQGEAPMVFAKEADIQYAHCILALRLPEVTLQQQPPRPAHLVAQGKQ